MKTKKPLCGAQPVMYTYPAWSFGGKHDKGYVPSGPGAGSIGASTTMGSTGPVFGPRSQASGQPAQPYGDGYATGEAYLKPGYLSQQPRSAAFSFGGKYRSPQQYSGPGPASYDTISASRNSMYSAPTSSWGPPPRPPRPSTAPQMWREEQPTTSKAFRGPSFGLAWTPSRVAPGPGPLDYQCECGGGCCRACQAYSGVSFKGRRPVMYGRITTVTPGPTAYHTGCSTIGVAAAHCIGAGTAALGSHNGPIRARNSRR